MFGAFNDAVLDDAEPTERSVDVPRGRMRCTRPFVFAIDVVLNDTLAKGTKRKKRDKADDGQCMTH